MTAPTDFRSLCAELLAWAEKTSAHYYSPPDVVVRARAALSAPQQGVPVAERLPVAEDCDAEGRCWWWAPKHPECPLTGHDSWGLYSGACIEDTHWLPHWALPLPQEARP